MSHGWKRDVGARRSRRYWRYPIPTPRSCDGQRCRIRHQASVAAGRVGICRRRERLRCPTRCTVTGASLTSGISLVVAVGAATERLGRFAINKMALQASHSPVTAGDAIATRFMADRRCDLEQSRSPHKHHHRLLRSVGAGPSTRRARSPAR
jgi:hypothetical protein